MRHPERCEIHGCHDAAHWYVHSDGVDVCEDHAVAALLMGRAVFGTNDERVALGPELEIVLA